MARTPSNMLALQTPMPEFNLPDTVSGKDFSSNQLNESVSVVMFICNHCPFVKYVNDQLVKLANDYIPKGVKFVAVSSNDVENYPDDSPEKMKETAITLKYPFPYLYDESQEVARALDAACTPDFYVFDRNKKLVYRGQLDDSRPSLDLPVTGKDLREALDQVLSGNPVTVVQRPSIGCNIKWKVPQE
jgi:thiol-disulfide isomerase/thioredoxin